MLFAKGIGMQESSQEGNCEEKLAQTEAARLPGGFQVPMEQSSRDVRSQSGKARCPELRRAIWAGEQRCRSPMGDSE